MDWNIAEGNWKQFKGKVPPLQLQKRLQSWFSATEQYPRQLHEVDRAACMDMKRSEYLPQQTS